MILKPELKTIAKLLVAEFNTRGATISHQEALNLAAKLEGYKNYAHYHKVQQTPSEPGHAEAPDESSELSVWDFFLHQFKERYGACGECPAYPKEDWQREVSENNTPRSYWEWVAEEAESNASSFHVTEVHLVRIVENDSEQAQLWWSLRSEAPWLTGGEGLDFAGPYPTQTEIVADVCKMFPLAKIVTEPESIQPEDEKQALGGSRLLQVTVLYQQQRDETVTAAVTGNVQALERLRHSVWFDMRCPPFEKGSISLESNTLDNLRYIEDTPKSDMALFEFDTKLTVRGLRDVAPWSMLRNMDYEVILTDTGDRPEPAIAGWKVL